MEFREDQFVGCLLGLALGDALGAPHEGGFAERLLWHFIGTTKDGAARWTDDTQMSLDLAESLLARGNLDPDDLAMRFACSYRWSRGYGPAAAKLLKKIRRGVPWRDANRSVYRSGSLGNGGAMRAPVIGLAFAGQRERLISAARTSAEVTHAHPLGLEGAVMIAVATATALQSPDASAILAESAAACGQSEFTSRLDRAREWIAAGATPPPSAVRRELGTGMTAQESCPTALYLAARFLGEPFSTLLDFTRQCGGDVDTIGAMAGALWGAANGSERLPDASLSRLEDCARIRQTALALHRSRL